MTLLATTSQTVGPFFKIGLSPLYRDQLAGPETPGERITMQGRVLDAQSKPVPDAVLEIWQADGAGKYSGSDPSDEESNTIGKDFFGFGRIPTSEDGTFRFSTIKPGSVPAPDGTPQAPHIVVSIFMRGLLIRLVTRIYFLDDPLNPNDFVLKLVDPERRSTLMATPASGNLVSLSGTFLYKEKTKLSFLISDDLPRSEMHKQVGIIGAGPAGLILSHLLHRQGIDSIVIEKFSRSHVQERVRAGVLEQGTVEMLAKMGLADRMQREGLIHYGIEAQFSRPPPSHRF